MRYRDLVDEVVDAAVDELEGADFAGPGNYASLTSAQAYFRTAMRHVSEQNGSAAIGNLNMAARLVPALAFPIQATIFAISRSRWRQALDAIQRHLAYINVQLGRRGRA
jgi:hypothetical protein